MMRTALAAAARRFWPRLGFFLRLGGLARLGFLVQLDLALMRTPPQ
jgi:hypothetical protein